MKKNKGEECAAVLRAMLNVKSAEEKVEKGQSGDNQFPNSFLYNILISTKLFEVFIVSGVLD